MYALFSRSTSHRRQMRLSCRFPTCAAKRANSCSPFTTSCLPSSTTAKSATAASETPRRPCFKLVFCTPGKFIHDTSQLQTFAAAYDRNNCAMIPICFANVVFCASFVLMFKRKLLCSDLQLPLYAPVVTEELLACKKYMYIFISIHDVK